VESALRAALPAYLGRISQRPPAFSAKKIGGQRAYKLARRGRLVTPRPVWVRLSRLELVARTPEGDFELEVHCSSGCYVRSLAVDLGVSLGSAAHVLALRRLACGSLGVDRAVQLDDIADTEGVRARLLPPEALPLRLKSVSLDAERARRFCHGLEVELERTTPISASLRVLSPSGRLLGVGEPSAPRPGGAVRLSPRVVLEAPE
jgi:tRNA pseudouridine55 synthase